MLDELAVIFPKYACVEGSVMSFRSVLISGNHDPVKRECYDCLHCQGAVTWWCKNKQAVERRGTSIPDTDNCPEWEPCITKQELGACGLGNYDVPLHGRVGLRSFSAGHSKNTIKMKGIWR